MSEEKQYLDEQWDGGPLPDEEKAWQHMQHLLDEDKKNRHVLPFWFWRYAGFGLLLVGLDVGTNYFLSKEQGITQEASAPRENSPKQNNTNTTTTNSIAGKQKTSTQQQETTVTPNGRSSIDKVLKEITKAKASVSQTNGLTNTKKNSSLKKKNNANKLESNAVDFKKEITSVNPPGRSNESVTPSENLKSEPVKSIVDPKAAALPLKETEATKIAEPIVTNKKSKKEKSDPVEFSFSAGVGLQRAIAFNGQHSSEYNYNGNRSVIADYIPSVYVRYQKRNWFAQAEFQYAVPLPVKQFVFSQKTSYSVATQNMSTEQVRMQKLYYHHLPVSINYFLLPDWSVGTGLMYSILKGAVTEQEITTKNVQTGNESVSKNIAPVKGFKDSFLFKSTAGIILQTDYQVKRFSMGLRYTQNFLAFIRYTTPTGDVVEEKNKTLQAILRFRLFEK